MALVVTFEDLVRLWGVSDLRRLSHLETSEDETVLKSRIDAWLQTSHDQFFGLIGYTSEDSPDYILNAAKGIIPALVRFHLLPSEANRDAYDLLMGQLMDLLKLKQKDKQIDPSGSGTDDVWIFVV
jgi:hypothetical protein